MVNERREALRRRYTSLGTGELAAAATFAVVAATSVSPRFEDRRDVAALWCALTPLLVVLVQAGGYWLFARSYVKQAPMPTAAAAAFRIFRFADVVLLVAGLVGVVVWWPDHTAAAATVAAVWIFGVMEYINYFVVRLAYPLRHWLTAVAQWRTPRLVEDINSTPR